MYNIAVTQYSGCMIEASGFTKGRVGGGGMAGQQSSLVCRGGQVSDGRGGETRSMILNWSMPTERGTRPLLPCTLLCGHCIPHFAFTHDTANARAAVFYFQRLVQHKVVTC